MYIYIYLDTSLLLQDELLRWEKSSIHMKAVATGDNVLETGEDADLENLYERLPVPKEFLKAHDYSSGKLNDEKWLKAMTTSIAKLRNAVEQHVTVSSEWDCSLEQLYIGTAALLLDKSGYVKKIVRPEKRIKIKSSFASQQYVLSVLALASWVRLTEEWHCAPCPSDLRLRCVSNHDAMQLRQLGLPVHRERVQSSTPLVNKVCAMCGLLMPPTSLTKDNWYHTGLAGPPCHVRGEPLPCSSWYAIPPFLMLWTKDRRS